MDTNKLLNEYQDQGFVMVKNVLSPDILKAAHDAVSMLCEQAKDITETDDRFDIDEGHSADNVRLTRIKLPHKQHAVFDEIMRSEKIISILKALLGPNVVLQTAKLNMKAPGGGAAVEWHQDWAFYPYTNDDVLALGIMLDDVDETNAPLQVIPKSHRGPVLNHHHNGVFAGAVSPDDDELDLSQAITLTGKAGDMSIHHARTLHGSAPNVSAHSRMMLFYECHAGDAWPLTGANSYFHRLSQKDMWEDLQDRILCGEVSLTPRIESNPVRLSLPPAPIGGSIFRTQKSSGVGSAFKSNTAAE